MLQALNDEPPSRQKISLPRTFLGEIPPDARHRRIAAQSFTVVRHAGRQTLRAATQQGVIIRVPNRMKHAVDRQRQ